MKKYLVSLFVFSVGFGIQCNAQSTVLWGVTSSGGTSDSAGTIFSYNLSTQTDSTVYNFQDTTTGMYPEGSLFQASNGLLYGTTNDGGLYKEGTIFSYNMTTHTYTVLYSFGKDSDGAYPSIGTQLIQAGDSLLYGVTEEGGSYVFLTGGTIFSFNIYTNTETVLHSFGNSGDGSGPNGPLLLAGNGLLYGVTNGGGATVNDSVGIIFSYNIATGVETVAHNFNTDGQYPWNGLIQVGDSLLYGLTSGTEAGNDSANGTLFSYNIFTNNVNVLHYFSSSNDSDGVDPTGALVKASNGLLYGATQNGGSSVSDGGIIFSYDIATGTENILYRFGQVPDAADIYGSLIQVGDSLLYGLANAGGTMGQGALISFNIFTGVETVVQSFTGTNGAFPQGNLIVIYNIGVGIKQVQAASTDLLIFPNPSSGQFTINLPGNESNYPIEVYNMLGQRVYQSVLAPGATGSLSTIDLSSQMAGMYFIYLQSQDGIKVGKVTLVK